MASKKQLAIQSLANLLKAQVRQNSGQGAPINAQQLYQQFLGSGLDYKGASSHGYGTTGFALSANAKYDFGDMILPGFLTANVSIGLSAAKTTQALLIIQRQPTSLGNLSSFSTNSPICMLCFGGAHLRLQLEQGAEVGLKMPETLSALLSKATELGGEEISVALEAEVTATASVLQGGEFLLLRADEPLWYSSAQESTLIEEFMGELGPGSKDQIKNEVAAFLKGKASRKVEKESLVLLQALDELSSQLSADDLALAQWHQEQLYQVILSEKQLTKSLAYQYLVELASGTTDLHLGTWQKSTFKSLITEDLLAKIAIAQTWLTRRPATADKKIESRLTRLTSLDRALRRHQEPPKPPGKTSRRYARLSDAKSTAPDPPYSGRSFLRLWGYAGAAQGVAEAKLSAGGKAAQNELSISGKLGADTHGRAASTRYRFQTCTTNKSGRQLLLTTQDTIITYVQADVGVAAEAALRYGGEEAKKAATAARRAAYNAMFWRSAVAYWLAPSDQATAEVSCERGSGLCYGMSVSIVRLRELAANPMMATSSLFKTMCWRLRAPAAQLTGFLQQAWFLRADFAFPTGAILLESAWTAPSGHKVGLTPADASRGRLPELRKEFRQGLEQAAGLDTKLGHEQPASKARLQSISARYRIADQVDSSRELFKLGYTFVVGGSLGLTRVEQAGTYSVVDIDTWWVDPDLRALAEASGPAAPYESAVPRVALFHQ
jgi:hypothetical protein